MGTVMNSMMFVMMITLSCVESKSNSFVYDKCHMIKSCISVSLSL